jgi:hypothetical protein
MAVTLWRVQVILPYVTGVPEDVSTNTLYITADDDPDFGELTDQIALLYNFVPDGFGHGTSWYLSALVDRGAGACKMRFYDMALPPPRLLIAETEWTLEEEADGFALPPEVAVCLSYKAAGPSQPRLRGRIFIGPLTDRALANDDSGTPAGSFRACLAITAATFAAAGPGNGYVWAGYSPTDDEAYVIHDGWVDNAFDTQRRRGVQATSRETWTT